MNNRIVKNTSILAFFTLIARILGFMRDLVIARMFGTSATVDSFYTAYKALSAFRGFLEGPLSQVFVPLLSEYRTKYSRAKERHLLATTIGTIGFCVLIFVALGIAFVPYIVKLFGPGLEPYRFNLARDFLRLTFPYLLLISFCGLGVATMNVYDHALEVAFTPIWLSISLITAALSFSSYFAIPITALAWAVLFGGLLQVLFVINFLRRVDLLVWPRIDFYDPGIRRVMKGLLPALLGASASQISMIINNNLASFLPVGTISCVYYADKVVYFPLSIIGISLSTALLRPLSQYHNENNMKAFDQTLGWSLRANLFAGVASSILIGMLSGPLIITFFMKGAFTASDAIQMNNAVVGYTLGISAFMLNKTLISAFYTRQDTRTPIIVVVLGALINIAIGTLLTPRIGQLGITIAGSIAAWIQMTLMLLWLGRPLSGLFNSNQGLRRWMLSTLLMSILLMVFCYITTPSLSTWLEWKQTYRLLRLSLIGAGTACIIGVVASYSGSFKQSP